mmetsp:Transcript_23027/g.69038  ORF Transcript_23027/g.69038 Transcript_23027/m.69038 type:complete len:219 (-) Transcript_23027:5-661(-)
MCSMRRSPIVMPAQPTSHPSMTSPAPRRNEILPLSNSRPLLASVPRYFTVIFLPATDFFLPEPRSSTSAVTPPRSESVFAAGAASARAASATASGFIFFCFLEACSSASSAARLSAGADALSSLSLASSSSDASGAAPLDQDHSDVVGPVSWTTTPKERSMSRSSSAMLKSFLARALLRFATARSTVAVNFARSALIVARFWARDGSATARTAQKSRQ